MFSVKATSHGSQDVSDGKNSRLIVDDINIRLSPRGHHVISFNITTGITTLYNEQLLNSVLAGYA